MIGRIGCTATAILNIYLWGSRRAYEAWWFSHYTIPELYINGVMSLSLFNVWVQADLTTAILATNIAYVKFRFPDSAVAGCRCAFH